jgi:hypothetical protein
MRFLDWVRIYVPKGSELVGKPQGSEVTVSTYDDLGKTVFEGFLTVRPQGATTYIISYTLPFKLAASSSLPAMYQKQPGTGSNQYTITVNGGHPQQFLLDQDKTIKVTP